MKKLLTLGLLSMLFFAFASSCASECEKDQKQIVKIQKRVNKALVKDDYKLAHQYLGELLLLPNRSCTDGQKEASVRDVFLAEIRFLVSKNDKTSWNRAQMLPMEVPNGFEKVQGDLYQALYDYAVAFDNEEIKENVEKTLAYLKGDRMIMPVSTSISGPMGEFFEVEGKEEGYKLIVDEGKEEWRWKFTVEVRRIKDGKVMKGGDRNDHGYICVNLLDEDNAVIESKCYDGYNDGVKVGETKLITISEDYDIERGYSWSERNLKLLERIKSVFKFEITSK